MTLRKSIILLSVFLLAACSGKDKKNKEEPAKEMERYEYRSDTVEVGIMVLKQTPFRKQLVSNGRVRAKEKSIIGFKTSGTIDKILVANGDYVRKGQVIAVLDTTDAQNSLRSALLSYEKAQLDLTDKVIGFGFTSLSDDIPEERLALAKLQSGFNSSDLSLSSAKANVEACTLRAPFSGKVADLKGHEYERVNSDFCTIIDDSRLTVEFTVLETELNFAKKGGHVRVSSFFNPEKYADGIITTVNPTVNDKGQVNIEAEIANDGSYIDGMNIRILIESEMPGQLVVPKNTVVMRDNLQVLFTYSQGKAKWTYVHTLMENSEEYVITPNTDRNAELAVGDTIIVAGNMNLAHDTTVKLAKQ